MVRVLIIDDHQMFVDGIDLVIGSSENLTVVAKAQSGEEAISIISKTPVDVILLDIDMPGLGGENTIEIIKKLYPRVRILILTMHDEGSYIRRFLEMDIDGYLLKNAGKQELISAIGHVYSGRQYFGSEILKKASLIIEQESLDEPDDLLSDREKEIVRLAANDFSIPQIADKLYISVNTVKTHRKNIQHKIDAKSLSGIIRYAIENGLADASDTVG